MMKGNLNDSISQANSGRPRWETLENNYLQTCDPEAMTMAEHSKEDSL